LNYKTRYTLIERALDLSDQEAWNELVEIYEPLIYHVLQSYNLQSHDVKNLSQEVLVKLTKNIEKYNAQKGNFRNWMGLIIKREALTLIRKRRGIKERLNQPNSENEMAALEKKLTSDDHREIFDREWQKYLLNIAWKRVRVDFSENAQRCFELSAEGFSTDEIMQKTGLALNSVKAFRASIKRALRVEVAHLEAEYDREAR